MRNNNYKHGHCTNGLTTEYVTWRDMKNRCNNPNCKSYKNYGGRGIGYCKRWESFENFFEDMGPRPDGKTLDRWPDNNGNYELSNCRWATWKEQANNRRSRSLGSSRQRWFVALSPKGGHFLSNNQRKFAKEHGLFQSGIGMCLIGKYVQYRKWKFGWI